MNVRLLTGRFFAVDGYAINDFESISLGDVEDLNNGVTTNQDCSWGETSFFSRFIE